MNIQEHSGTIALYNRAENELGIPQYSHERQINVDEWATLLQQIQKEEPETGSN